MIETSESLYLCIPAASQGTTVPNVTKVGIHSTHVPHKTRQIITLVGRVLTVRSGYWRPN